MSARWLLGAGVLAFLVGVSSLLPARVVYQWFAPDELRLAGISGTLWNGRAQHASVSGWYVRNLEWQTQPLALVLGQAKARLSGEPHAGFFEATVGVGIGGRVTVSAATASVSLASLASALSQPGLSGGANLRIEHLEIRDGLPVAATGRLAVDSLFAPLVYEAAPIGGYAAEFFTREDGIAASVEDTDGVLDIAGSLTVPPSPISAVAGLRKTTGSSGTSLFISAACRA